MTFKKESNFHLLIQNSKLVFLIKLVNEFFKHIFIFELFNVVNSNYYYYLLFIILID